MIVLDNSAAIELFLNTPRGSLVAQSLEGRAVYAPQLLAVEFLSVLKRAERAGHISSFRCQQAIQDLQDFGIIWIDVPNLVSAVWKRRHDYSVYDASYVALAETLDCPLLTFDEKLASRTGVAQTPGR